MTKILLFTWLLGQLFISNPKQNGTTAQPAKSKAETKDTVAFKPSGKVEGKIYADFHTTSTKEKVGEKTMNHQFSAFEITRAYFGYKYQFSKKFSGNVKIDVGADDVSVYTAYLKSAGLTWKATDNLTVDFGLIDTREFKLQEGFWGHRYFYKSFQDQNHFGSSADAGAIATYKIHKLVSIDLGVLNGEGYKKAQDINGQFKLAGGVTVTPVSGLYIRGYYDYSTIASTDSNRMNNQATIATFAGYKMKDKFNIGAEYNIQNNHKNMKDENLSGFSFYGEYFVKKQLGVVARFDQLTSNKLTANEKNPWNISSDGQTLIGGIEFKPVKGVSTCLNYQEWMPAKTGSYNVSSVYLSLQYKF